MRLFIRDVAVVVCALLLVWAITIILVVVLFS